jgi:soluble lytic murein transglycosylase-like protein
MVTRTHAPRRLSLRAATASLAVFISSVGTLVPASAAQNPCETEILRAAGQYGIPVGILYSVGLTETGKKGTLQPYALNVEGKAYFPPTRTAALRIFDQAEARGARLIDIGCMQINHLYHGSHFASVAQMFDPHLNVDYAAQFLADLKRKHVSWSMAVARYHAGPNNDPAQKQYVCRVIANMVATGFGKWTPNARRFCN